MWIDEVKKWLKELREVHDQVCMITGELQKEKDILKSKKEVEIDLLEWRLRMEKILMKDNDQDEYFQYIELHKIKEKSKQKVDEINELITIKEWDIIGGDWESKFDGYAEDIKKELKIVEIRLKKFKMSEEILEDIKYEYLNGVMIKEKKRFFFCCFLFCFSIIFFVFFQFLFFLCRHMICFFHILFLYFFLQIMSIFIFCSLSLDNSLLFS